jgi:integrase
MGRKRTPGLFKRNGIWHIDKVIHGRRLCESTGTGNLEEAERRLAKNISETTEATIYGIRPKRTFREAATKYLSENLHKARIGDTARHIKQLDPFIGDLSLDRVHLDTLRPFIESRQSEGRRSKTINIALSVVRRILNLAARVWHDENGLTWLAQAPLIEILSVHDEKTAYPLDWSEQTKLIQKLPPHLARMALFKVNTGCREAEVCGLKWEWELDIPGFEPITFLIPAGVQLTKARGSQVKNGHDRVVVCNDIARSVIDSARGDHPEYVFHYDGRQLPKMLTSAWKRAWKAAGLPEGADYLKGPHNLKHTYGRRLRAAGVPKDTRKVLLGHRSGDITDHYSVPELQDLFDASNRVSEAQSRKSPALHMVKRKAAIA